LRLAELGYLGLLIPQEYGGQGAPFFHGILTLEEVARVCFNTALICQLYLNGPSRAITVLGNEEQKRRWLPGSARGEYLFAIAISEPEAGSATTDLTTSVERRDGGYVLNGLKHFVTAGHLCTHALVFARFGPSQGAKGIGAVIVERERPGFEVGPPERKMGGRGMAEAELRFDNCWIPEENVLVAATPDSSEGFKKLMRAFGPERCGNAAMCVGLAQGAYELAVQYAKERKQFGRPICEFQGIQWKVADMKIKIDAARLLVYRASCNAVEGFPDPLEAAVAKAYANQIAQEVTNEALQIHGHYGYTREFPLERMVRDARGFALGGGTIEILKNTIASFEFGRTFNQRTN
ncbi:MAG: acyl-CoA dehydrogenase family protein, partial [Clostridia bacterium]|nr:acyl-CoA dehydrogenase family protein [Clostridia bacterium]